MALFHPYPAAALSALTFWLQGCGSSVNEGPSELEAESNKARVVSCSPGNGAAPDSAISCTLALAGSGVDGKTLNASTVKLTLNGKVVACQPGTSGGRDSITCTPQLDLEPMQTYVFQITSGVKDEEGRAFESFKMEFKTGTADSIPLSPFRFNRRQVFSGPDVCFSLEVGPDGRLYCAAPGRIIRWDLKEDGTLGMRATYAPKFLTEAKGPRAIIGLAFRAKGELWISHNAPVTENAPDFSGRITRLTWDPDGSFSNDAVTSKLHVEGLPRSARDHLSNSLMFQGDFLYLNQGSNTAMGQAQKDAWKNRPERLLSAAVLKIDSRGSGSIDVRTPDGGGKYNPRASGARVTLYATGIRNAYDLVWHSNGQLYTATNGSAGGGSTPACNGAPGISNAATQNDYLFRIEQGGYYGHPNPTRDECVMNRGNVNNNKGAGDVVAEGSNNGYERGQKPEATYRGFIHNLGRNKSPNGMIEYHRGALNKQLFITRWSAGDDIIIAPAPVTGMIDAALVRRLDCGGRFVNPIDMTEDLAKGAKSGNLYVSEMKPAGEFYTGRIQLCNPQF